MNKRQKKTFCLEFTLHVGTIYTLNSLFLILPCHFPKYFNGLLFDILTETSLRYSETEPLTSFDISRALLSHIQAWIPLLPEKSQMIWLNPKSSFRKVSIDLNMNYLLKLFQ